MASRMNFAYRGRPGRYRGPRRMVAAYVTFVDGWVAALESDCVC
jgi:hypothetical protein